MQVLGLVRISKNTKSTVSKSEGVLDVMSYAGFWFGLDIQKYEIHRFKI